MQDKKPTNAAAPDNEPQFADVPANFPRPVRLGAIGGAQPKLLMTRYGEKFYSPGATPPQIVERWRYCEYIAEHLRMKSLESKSGKRAEMTEAAILAQYLGRLIATGWVSEAEGRWTIRRCAALLGGWPLPPDLEEPASPPE